jgi:hypothetical protein
MTVKYMCVCVVLGAALHICRLRDQFLTLCDKQRDPVSNQLPSPVAARVADTARKIIQVGVHMVVSV